MLRTRASGSILFVLLATALTGCGGDNNTHLDGSVIDVPGPDTGRGDTGAVGDASDVGVVRDANSDVATPDAAPDASTPAVCTAPLLIDLDQVGTRAGNVITYTGSNTNAPATSELAAPSCQGAPGHPVVLAHRMQTTAQLRASTNNTGTDFDTVLWALDRCGPAGATELGCGDDTNTSPRETASTFVTDAPVPAGTMVYLVVAGYDTGTGNFDLTVSELAEVAAGGACDPEGVQNVCAAGLVCQAATGGGTGTVCSPPAYSESELPDGVFRDACAQGTHLVLPATATGRDDGHPDAAVPVPFAFRFFGRQVNALWPSTNGYAVFDSAPSDSPGGDLYLPEPNEGPVVAPLWQDLALHDAPAGDLCAGTFGTMPDREFVIEWQDAMPTGSTTAHVTFELVLHERTGLIDFLYARLDPGESPPEETGGLWASIGLQAGADGRYVLHSGEVSTTVGIRWTPAP